MTSNSAIRKDKSKGCCLKLVRQLKIVVGVVSFVCFVFQSIELTRQYRNYATVVTTELVKHKQIKMPAVTVCKPVVFGYRMFCAGNESDEKCVVRWAREDGIKIESGEELDYYNDQMSVLRFQEDKLVSSKPLLQLFSNMSLLKNFHGTSCDVRRRPCPENNQIFYLMEKQTVNRTEKIIWSIIYNKLGFELCFTAFSQLAFDNEKIVVDDLSWVTHFNLVFNYSEWFPSNFPTFGYNIAVHPANLIPCESFWQFHRIKPNNFYQIEYGMTREHLLPGPYQTNCRDYQPPGPLSHQDCLVRCVFNNSWVPKGQCYQREVDVVILNHLQPTDRLCSFHEDLEFQLDYQSINKKCEESCPKGCYEEHFWSVRELYDDDLRFDKNASNYAQVRFRYSRRSDLTIRHQPEIMFGNYIASIGGLAGVYLGISILSMYEYFCSLLEKISLLKEKIKIFSRP